MLDWKLFGTLVFSLLTVEIIKEIYQWVLYYQYQKQSKKAAANLPEGLKSLAMLGMLDNTLYPLGVDSAGNPMITLQGGLDEAGVPSKTPTPGGYV